MAGVSRPPTVVRFQPPRPPSPSNTAPAPSDVTTSAAMLKTVRCSGLRVPRAAVHWTHALVAAITIVACVPSISSAANSNANDRDIVAP